MRTWRRFYRRHRIAVTAAALGVAALVLVGRVPLMPDADALFTPVSGVSTLVASPVAGGALVFRQRSRKAAFSAVFSAGNFPSEALRCLHLPCKCGRLKGHSKGTENFP